MVVHAFMENALIADVITITASLIVTHLSFFDDVFHGYELLNVEQRVYNEPKHCDNIDRLPLLQSRTVVSHAIT